MCPATEELYQEGIEEGIRIGERRIIQKMLYRRMSVEEIQRFTDLPVEEIKRLKKRRSTFRR